MDIVSGLAALGQAVQIVKDLQSIEHKLDSAVIKAKMAELYGSLADAKIALTDAREIIHKKDQQISELQANIDALALGDNCPLCQDGRLKITASRPHPDLGTFGVQERTVTCENTSCNHSEKRLYDPQKAKS